MREVHKNAIELIEKNWNNVYNSLTPDGDEVILMYNPKWIDKTNPMGVRVGFYNEQNDMYVSAYYCYYNEFYMTISDGDVDESFPEKIKSNINPTHWIYLEKLITGNN